MSIVKKIFSVMLANTLLLSLFATSVNAEVYEEEEIISSVYGLVSEDYVPNLPEEEEEEETHTTLTSYDPRLTNAMTAVKDQSSLGVCWAFASIAVLESANYHNTGLKYTYSEEALRFIASKDTVNQFTGSSDFGKYLRSSHGGGNAYHAMPYFTSINSPVTKQINWISPNLDSDIAYTNSSQASWPTALDSSYANSYATDLMYIDFRYAKDYVLEYGGVYLSFDATTYNSNTNSFYTDISVDSASHAVLLVGWDDNYSKENFREELQPSSDGAWLVKNSWGTSANSDGYYWISYEDVSLNDSKAAFVIANVEAVSKNEHMLYYDYVPMFRDTEDNIEYTISSENENVYIANVYDMTEFSNDYGTINKVMFYSADIDSFYRIYVVPMTAEDETLPSLSELGSTKAYGTVDHEGYITAEFTTPVTFNEDTEKIAVIVRFTGDSSTHSNLQIAQERNTNLFDPVSHAGESYYYKSENSSWVDIANGEISNSGNFCIRPTLVRRTPITQDSTLSSNNLTYAGSDVTVNLNLNGNLLFRITENGNTTLFEDNQFTRTEDSVTFKSSYLSSLDVNEYKNIAFEFTDGNSQILRITRKNNLPNITIGGKVAVGQTVSALFDDTSATSGISYQWQSSTDGTNWTNVDNATSDIYLIDNSNLLKYLRVKINSQDNSTYVYPQEKLSSASTNRVVMYGDVNFDGRINVSDSTLVQKYVSDLVDFNTEQIIAADVDGDGRISVYDANLISKYSTGIIEVFPVENS
ncbi:MAG: C1 family peptidase [Ruminococcus sp.]